MNNTAAKGSSVSIPARRSDIPQRSPPQHQHAYNHNSSINPIVSNNSPNDNHINYALNASAVSTIVAGGSTVGGASSSSVSVPSMLSPSPPRSSQPHRSTTTPPSSSPLASPRGDASANNTINPTHGGGGRVGLSSASPSQRRSAFYRKVVEEYTAPMAPLDVLRKVPRAPLLSRKVFTEDVTSYTKVVRQRRQERSDKEVARRVAMLTSTNHHQEERTRSGSTSSKGGLSPRSGRGGEATPSSHLLDLDNHGGYGGRSTHSYLEVNSGVREQMRRDLCERWATIIFTVGFMRVRGLAAEAKALDTLRRLLIPVIRRVRAKRRRRERMLLCIAEFVSEMKAPDHRTLRANPCFHRWEDGPLHTIINELVPQAFGADEILVRARTYSDVYILNSGAIDVISAAGSVVGHVSTYGTVFGEYSALTLEPLPVGYRAGRGKRVLAWVLPRKVFIQQAAKNANEATVPMASLSVRQHMLNVSHPLQVEALLFNQLLRQLPLDRLEVMVRCMRPVSFTSQQTVYNYRTTEGFLVVARGTVTVTSAHFPPPRMRRPQFAPTRLSKHQDPYPPEVPTMVTAQVGPWGCIGVTKCLLDASFDGEVAVANCAVDAYFCPLREVKYAIGCYAVGSPAVGNGGQGSTSRRPSVAASVVYGGGVANNFSAFADSQSMPPTSARNSIIAPTLSQYSGGGGARRGQRPAQQQQQQQQRGRSDSVVSTATTANTAYSTATTNPYPTNASNYSTAAGSSLTLNALTAGNTGELPGGGGLAVPLLMAVPIAANLRRPFVVDGDDDTAVSPSPSPSAALGGGKGLPTVTSSVMGAVQTIPLLRAIDSASATPLIKTLFTCLQQEHAARLRLMATGALVESLRCDPLLEPLPTEFVAALARAAVPMWYPAGRVIMGHGGGPPRIVVVSSGLCAAEPPKSLGGGSALAALMGGLGAPSPPPMRQQQEGGDATVDASNSLLSPSQRNNSSSGHRRSASVRYSLPAPPRTSIHNWTQTLPPGTVVGAAAVMCDCLWEYGLNVVACSQSVEVFEISLEGFRRAVAEAVPNKTARLQLLNTIKESGMRVVRSEPFCLMD